RERILQATGRISGRHSWTSADRKSGAGDPSETAAGRLAAAGSRDQDCIAAPGVLVTARLVEPLVLGNGNEDWGVSDVESRDRRLLQAAWQGKTKTPRGAGAPEGGSGSGGRSFVQNPGKTGCWSCSLAENRPPPPAVASRNIRRSNRERAWCRLAPDRRKPPVATAAGRAQSRRA